VETRLKSESFEPVIGFLVSLVQTLRYNNILTKVVKQSFWLIFTKFIFFLGVTFEPETR